VAEKKRGVKCGREKGMEREEGKGEGGSKCGIRGSYDEYRAKYYSPTN